MTLQFPNNPSTGQQFTASNGLIYRWDGEKWITLGSAQSTGDIYVQNTGDTMTGQLVLPGGGTGKQAATVDQVDAAVKKAGDTMTGDLNLPNLVATGNIQSTSQNGSQLAGFRNQIINGNVVVRQRADTTANSFVADRWFTATAGCGTSNAGPDGLGLKRVITIPAAGGFIRQALELDNPNRQSQFYPNSTWTARVYSTAAPQLRLAFRKTSDDITDQSEVLANTAMTAGATVDGYTEYTYTITMPDVTGDVQTNQLKTLVIWFQTSGAASLTGMTFEPGPVATPFEHRPIGTELALCQRYYRTGSVRYWGYVQNAQNYVAQDTFPAMRAAPTAQLVSTLGVAGDNSQFPDHTGCSIRDTTTTSVASLGNSTASGTGRYWFGYTAEAEL